MNGHIVAPFRRRPELFRSPPANFRHASSGWGETPLGIVQELTGDYPAAAASLTQALQLSRDLGDRKAKPAP